MSCTPGAQSLKLSGPLRTRSLTGFNVSDKAFSRKSKQYFRSDYLDLTQHTEQKQNVGNFGVRLQCHGHARLCVLSVQNRGSASFVEHLAYIIVVAKVVSDVGAVLTPIL
ncbi:hypothetical protein CONPUDRAFT_138939 [Coniophora puteana RWD-64-598 SS2]|uniref:Uncharacterized protein n=1 Tax=Coniophora puteana (strain RWD-64-598) TaxID=741705 RepID=A0A5M3MG14_CONPW|nr:uncharacterized protein CONPUDRAFT_138939 [Coniophora puteana RWD-64-598 SS2]EIW77704.1 hypothetical protein CONPUDRAFT_138939 [Coniophora puteana RWD-64-598 SS2]